MNKVTITEANRQFTHLTKQVDAEGQVAITKGGDIKYIMMTQNEYERMNTEVLFCKSGDYKVYVEKTEKEARIWKFDNDFESYVFYAADKINIENGVINLEAEKFFKLSFREMMFEEPDEKAEEIIEKFPDILPEYKLSVKSRDKIWE